MAELHFLHARVHRGLFRALAERGFAIASPAALVVLALCPMCGACWFAPLQTALRPDERERVEDDATRQLSEDCPDHAHRFNLPVPVPQPQR